MFDIVIHRGDSLPKIRKTVFMNGAPMALDGYTITFKCLTTDGVEIFEHPAALVANQTGLVEYQWTDADSDLVDQDIVAAQFFATSGGNSFTVPNNRPMSLMLASDTKHEYSYSGDPSANTRDAIRFILSDTGAPWKWGNEEIDYMVSVYQTPYAVAAELAFQQAGKYADQRDKTVGPLSIKYGEIGERWYKFAAELKSRFSRKGGAKAIMTQCSTGPYIKLGMHDLNYAHNKALELLGEETL